jgi:hypothetical protein
MIGLLTAASTGPALGLPPCLRAFRNGAGRLNPSNPLPALLEAPSPAVRAVPGRLGDRFVKQQRFVRAPTVLVLPR